MKVLLSSLFHSFLRILASVLVCVAVFDILLKIAEVFENYTPFEYAYWDINGTIYTFLVYLGIALGIIWSIYERQKENLTNALNHFCQLFIRIWLAFLISSYGFAKILRTQFEVPEHIKDIPINALHPFYLTWYYFGFSREYALILAAIEISGAFFLLFRKTRLLGSAILFPTMLNLVFINKFYFINPWSLLASIFFTLGTFYLLLIDLEKIKSTFFNFTIKLKWNISGLIRTSLKALVLLAAFGLIWMYANDSPINNTFLKGVWSVEAMKKGADPITYPNNKDSVLTKLYFEYASPERIVLEFNHHTNRLRANYQLSSNNDSLIILAVDQRIQLRINQLNAETLKLDGLQGDDSLQLILKKVRNSSR